MSAAAALKLKTLSEFEVSLSSRDRLRLALDVDENGTILSAQLTGSGCSELLSLLGTVRPLLKGKLADLQLPEGRSHSAILMRELLLKAKEQWNFPYKEEELCHCRAVSTRKVDDAIISGCHTVEAVKRATSASTSCGTCRWDIESILKYRLGT
jgi:bacterioferritin-associated ferredoxin